MPNTLLLDFQTSMLEDDCSANRKKWAKIIVKKNINLLEWLPLLEAEHKIATRFLWTMGDVCELNPTQIKPLIPPCFAQRNSCQVAGFKRTLTKWLMLAGIPEDLEGLVLDQLLRWIMDGKIKVAVKAYGLEVLATLAEKYPDIIPELLLVMEEYGKVNTAAFQYKCKKISLQLKKIAPPNL